MTSANTAASLDPNQALNIGQGLDVAADVLARSKSKVSAAKVALLLDTQYMFFSSILLKMEVKFVTSMSTAYTNGKVIAFNPNFVEKLTQAETLFILMHELHHVILKHVGRRSGRDPKLWNAACDYVINTKLVELGFKMPASGGLYDSKYLGKSADEVYFELFQERLDNPSSQQPEPDHDDLGADDQMSEATEEEINDLINAGVVAAQREGGKAVGNIPGNLLSQYEQLINPKVPWQTLLNRFLFGTAKNDYSMKKPNRRYLAHGYVLPSLYSESMDQIDFAIDTSGSVSQAMMQEFLGEIANVFKRFSPERIGIMQFDHDLKSRDVIKSVKEFAKIEFRGGGGTDVLPVLEAFKENAAKALVIITDGYFHHDPSWNPKKPVIWVVYDNNSFKPPFGKVAYFDL